ncbi:hypothetical protein P389DRAFT_113090 [Cystobasidium minutum MCA 4210]|uniref:uncharacterized protein n=1 Tax=Cystobasidium minutum MCA 4210 TaxID=1397322 RepID=UPI0034CF5398|eukprot:jgi/Rhomi1/113090/CE113089_65
MFFKLSSTFVAMTTLSSGLVMARYADISCNSIASTTPTPDQALCTLAGSAGACTLDTLSGDYFCGWEGGSCPDPSGTIYETESSACDFGTCVDGKCAGTFGDSCDPIDPLRGCLGFLTCSPSGICAGEEAPCFDFDGCLSGLECVFPSETALAGVCQLITIPPPGPSQRRYRREVDAKRRTPSWH